MPISLEDATEVLRGYGLPQATGLRMLRGGLSHETYRVTVGDPRSVRRHPAYVLKRMVAGTSRPDFIEGLTTAWRVEKRMYAAGVPMPRPVPNPRTGAGHVRVVGLGTFRLHEFVDGAPASEVADRDDVVTRAGALLAAVHLAAEPAPAQRVDLAGFGFLEAAGLLAEVEPSRLAQLQAAAPAARRLADVLAHQQVTLRPALGTHRDVDPKNVLRRPNGDLLLVDWDVAAPADPMVELTVGALDWGGAVDRRFVPALAHAFLAGYRTAGGTAAVVEDGVAVWLLQYLRWFEFGLRQRAKAAMVAYGAAVGPLTLPASSTATVVDWGCGWATQTEGDLPAIREWVRGQSSPRRRLLHLVPDQAATPG